MSFIATAVATSRRPRSAAVRLPPLPRQVASGQARGDVPGDHGPVAADPGLSRHLADQAAEDPHRRRRCRAPRATRPGRAARRARSRPSRPGPRPSCCCRRRSRARRQAVSQSPLRPAAAPVAVTPRPGTAAFSAISRSAIFSARSYCPISGCASSAAATRDRPPRSAASTASSSYADTCATSPRISGGSGAAGTGAGPLGPDHRGHLDDRLVRAGSRSVPSLRTLTTWTSPASREQRREQRDGRLGVERAAPLAEQLRLGVERRVGVHPQQLGLDRRDRGRPGAGDVRCSATTASCS